MEELEILESTHEACFRIKRVLDQELKNDLTPEVKTQIIAFTRGELEFLEM